MPNLSNILFAFLTTITHQLWFAYNSLRAHECTQTHTHNHLKSSGKTYSFHPLVLCFSHRVRWNTRFDFSMTVLEVLGWKYRTYQCFYCSWVTPIFSGFPTYSIQSLILLFHWHSSFNDEFNLKPRTTNNIPGKFQQQRIRLNCFS